MFRYACLLVTLVSALPLAGVELCVEVVDPDARAVTGATVSLAPTEERAVVVGLTGDDGRSCSRISQGFYTLAVTSEGFLSVERTLHVASEDSDTVRVELQLPVVSDRVQVTASRLPENLVDAPVPVQLIDRSDVERMASRHMGDVMQEQASIVTFAGASHSGGHSTNIEGFKSRDVQLLIDGQPLVGRVSGYVDMSEIDTGILEAVEVRPGASSVMYGSQGMGGAINMVTRRATSGYQVGAEAGYGSFDTGLARVDGGFAAENGFAGYMSAYGLRSLGYNLDSSSTVPTQSPDRQTNLFGNFYLPPIKKLSLGITGMYFGKRYWGFDESSSLGVYDFQRPRQRLVVVPRGSLATSVNSLLSFRLRHVGYRRSEDLYYRQSGLTEIESNVSTSQGAEAEWNWMINGIHRLGLGTYYNHESITSERISLSDGEADRDTYVNFGVLDVNLHRDLKVHGGFRYDHDSLFGDEVSPRAGIAWHVARSVSLSFSAARGYRAPDFNELYIYHSHAGGRVVVIGNPDLTPQRAWSYSLSSLFRLGRAGRLETRLFRHDMSNLIDSKFVRREGSASIYQYENITEAVSTGASITYRNNFGRSWDVMTSYQLMSTNDAANETPLEYAPRHRVAFRIGYWNRKADLMITAFGNATGDTFLGVSGDAWEWMDRFEMIGLSASKRIHKGLSLRATFRNLSDNVDPDYRLTAPRSAEIALIYRFTRE